MEGKRIEKKIEDESNVRQKREERRKKKKQERRELITKHLLCPVIS